MAKWQFWIDVGGTFSDAIARSPAGELHSVKVLSSAHVKGRPQEDRGPLRDPALVGRADDFFCGFECVAFDELGEECGRAQVLASSGASGEIVVAGLESVRSSIRSFELRSPEEAPLLAIRSILDLRLDQAVPDLDLRLGTTRGTNALLERKGARCAFVTTKGFADVLRIAYQNRPDLFALDIVLPDPLYARAIELPGRIDAGGEVLEEFDAEATLRAFEKLREDGFDVLAICLLNAYRNPEHERRAGEIAESLGFGRVYLSADCARRIKLVSRGDTTVVDAYLTPVLDDYVQLIADKLSAASSFRLLTSSGGLVRPESFRGKDSVLSGPAGGVVGVARVAEDHGCARAIGFDMGGTSTDVSRYDDGYEMQFECEKAGVRLVTPMLAIETVAAGGGSICSFDGERLRVGPESAGSNPGPACYGAGGPLTVTDVNVALGRIPVDRFPFRLDRDAVERRLEELAQRVKGGRSTQDLALGFHRIASAAMAAAIRKISVARGYDVRNYTLVVFGGAGGQHACSVAAELGVTQILVPRFAGVLSAYGAGLADVRKFAERPATHRGRELSVDDLDLGSLEAEVLELLRDDDVPEDCIEPVRCFAEVRYLGQDAALDVDLAKTSIRATFEAEHERRFGYRHAQRDIEIVNVRAECVGRNPGLPTLALNAEGGESTQKQRAVFSGEEIDVEVWSAESLRASDSIEGPAIVAAPFHTLVVEPGWIASFDDRGDMTLSFSAAAVSDRKPESGDTPDPVQLEIFHQRFASIAEEMGLVLRNSALSTNVRERLDYSCAVFDSSGDLVANAPHIPVHLGAMSNCVRHVIESVDQLRPGDVIVTNDPFAGGTHLPDVTVVTPVFLNGEGASPDTELTSTEADYFVASRAHHSEIGGIRPGSMPPDSRTLEEEGVVIRGFKVLDAGKPRFDELRSVFETARYPSRSPGENLADVAAQIAANRAGETLLGGLAAECGHDELARYTGFIQDAAARLMRDRLTALGDRDLEFEDALDDGSTIRLRLSIRSGEATVDFAGTSAVHEGNLNATAAIVASAVLYCFRLLLDEDIPLNAGVLDPVTILLPECFLNPPFVADAAKNAAVAAGNVETSQRIVDTVLGALGIAAASQGSMNNFLFGNDRFGYYETIAGGAGATPQRSGASAVHTHMTNTRITDPEIFESRYPARIRSFAIRPDSGGAGKHRGGDGVVREFEFLEDVEVSLITQRRTRPPYGLAGGQAGELGRNLRRAPDGEWVELGGISTFRAGKGDRLRIETPGGGGFGKSQD